MTQSLICWKCATTLDGVLLPVARLEECAHCSADLHVCRMCRFYDPGVADACREPIAEPVGDKQRANFCGYFEPGPNAYETGGGTADGKAEAALSALFGIESTERTESSPGDELNRLFGLDGESDEGGGHKP